MLYCNSKRVTPEISSRYIQDWESVYMSKLAKITSSIQVGKLMEKSCFALLNHIWDINGESSSIESTLVVSTWKKTLKFFLKRKKLLTTIEPLVGIFATAYG